MPQRVHTMRGPNMGTGMSSGHGTALMTALWWQCQQDTASVIGSIGSLMRLAASRRL
jgi:hypothetical protein